MKDVEYLSNTKGFLEIVNKYKYSKKENTGFFDLQQINSVDLIKWNPLSADPDWYNANKYTILLGEFPVYLHQYVNHPVSNHDEFVEIAKKVVKQKKDNYIDLAILSIYRLTKVEKRPLLFGFSRKTENNEERDILLAKSALRLLDIIESHVEENDKVGIFINEKSFDSFDDYITENSNLKIGKVFEVGKLPEDFMDLFNPSNYSELLNTYY